MPTYEYECQKCEHVFDVFHGMTEQGPKRCPECRGKVKKLIGAGSGLIFKGSGFYITDYKKKTGVPDSESTSKSKSSSDGDASTKSSDKKTETKKTESKKSDSKKSESKSS